MTFKPRHIAALLAAASLFTAPPAIAPATAAPAHSHPASADARLKALYERNRTSPPSSPISFIVTLNQVQHDEV